MYADKLNNTLKKWSNSEKSQFKNECASKVSPFLDNSEQYCKCTLKNLMKGINYETYAKASEYQKGTLTALHGRSDCKAVKKPDTN